MRSTVLLVGCHAEIADIVISSISIYMINLRKIKEVGEKRLRDNSVHLELFPADVDKHITVPILSAKGALRSTVEGLCD